MNRGILVVAAAIATAALPLHAGMVISSTVSTPTVVGTFTGGTTIYVSVTGTVTLNAGAGGCITTNPDGSLASSVVGISSSDPCWSGYGGFIKENSTGYPTAAGGDGINHFAGGGFNYDVNFNSASVSGGPFPLEGKPTTDTTDPGAIRLGALAGTFAASPTATDWFVIGAPLGGGNFGGTFVVPGSGLQTLQVVLVDTNYATAGGANTGSYDITAAEVPEPSATWLVLSGAGLLGLPQIRRRLARRS